MKSKDINISKDLVKVYKKLIINSLKNATSATIIEGVLKNYYINTEYNVKISFLFQINEIDIYFEDGDRLEFSYNNFSDFLLYFLILNKYDEFLKIDKLKKQKITDDKYLKKIPISIQRIYKINKT
jgi:hypothetical protein